jgi:hypothetical protein
MVKSASAAFTGNTIKGNGQLTIERTEEQLVDWTAEAVCAYRTGLGMSGLSVSDHSDALLVEGNAIEENGRPGTAVEQVALDKTSTCHDLDTVWIVEGLRGLDGLTTETSIKQVIDE